MVGPTNAKPLGGANLNFQVVGGITIPAAPVENTIWVETAVGITEWTFSPTQPSSSEGAVWIRTGSASTVQFNALTSNEIIVHPLSGKQFVDGVWVEKTMKIYQGGEWLDFVTWLYNVGETFDELTGGWKFEVDTGGRGYLEADHMYLGYEGTRGRSAAAYTNNKINLVGYTKLHAEIDATSVSSGFFIGVSTQNTSYSYTDFKASTKTEATGPQILSLDLTAYQGEFYVCLAASISTAEIYKVYLE